MFVLLVTLLATVIGLGIATVLVPGINVKNLVVFVIASLVLGLINAFIRPVLWFLTAPLSVLSFGLFALVVNALMIMLASALVPGFEVKGFGSALLGAIVMAIVGILGLVAITLLSGGDINWYSYEFHSQTFSN